MPESKFSGSHLTLQILAGLVAVYFLFPVLLIWPFVMLYGPTGARAPRRVVKAVRLSLAPLRWLGEKVPPYQTFIQTEFDCFGIK